MNTALRAIVPIAVLVLLLQGSTYAQAPTGEIEILTIGRSIDREIRGGVIHAFDLDLKEGQFCLFTVEQRGITLEVQILDQSGHMVQKYFGPETAGEPEDYKYVAPRSGIFRVEVHVEAKDAPPAQYQIKLVEIRAATQQEKDKAVPEDLLFEAEELLYQNTEASKRAALRKLEDAVPLFEKLGDKSSEAHALTNICFSYYSLGDPKKALGFGLRALTLARELGDQKAEANILNSLGVIYRDTGDPLKSIEILQQALKLPRDALGAVERGTTLNNIASRYLDLGEYQRAIDHYLQALEVFRAGDEKNGEGRALSNLGVVYRLVKDDQKALAINLEALEFSRRTGNLQNEGLSLINISAIYSDQQDFKRSVEYSELAIVKLREAGDRKDEVKAVNNLANSLSALGDTQKALDLLMNVVPYQRAASDLFNEPLVFRNVAVIAQKQGDLRLAAFFGKVSVNGYQSLRSSIRGLGRSTQKTFLRTIERGYRPVADMLIADGRLTEGFRVLNLFKDQQFFDFGSSTEPGNIELTARETKLKAEFDHKIAEVVERIRQVDEAKNAFAGREPSAAQTEDLGSAERELALANVRYRDFLTVLRGEFASPVNESDAPPASNDLADLQAAIRETSAATGQPVATVYTLVGEHGYRALIVTSDEIAEVSSKIEGKDLDTKIQRFWQLIHSPQFEPRPVAKEIYDLVFEPVEKKLPPGTSTILWSLDGNLRYIPMAALYDGKRYLVERYNNVVFTRADKERMTRKQSRLAIGTGFGSSEAHTVDILGTKFNASALPSVKMELSRIFKSGRQRGVLSGNVLLDGKFTKESMLLALKGRQPLVHIASHFRFEPGDEARSFLLMGDGTPFTLDEMKTQTDLFAGVDLLALSACETAAQKPDANGREVDGFAELAQRQGAGAVMASLWEVSDSSTAELMSRFYANYSSVSGANKASAMRNAQLALLRGSYREVGSAQRQLEREKSGKDTTLVPNAKPFRRLANAPYAHPYYWSPFILIGNWR